MTATKPQQIPNRIAIQCTDATTGKVGTFTFHDSEPFVALSPVFDSYYELFDWHRKNGTLNVFPRN